MASSLSVPRHEAGRAAASETTATCSPQSRPCASKAASTSISAFTDSKKYRKPEKAAASLERAGWRDVRASLFEAPIPFEDRDAAALYVQGILLRDHVARLPEDLRNDYCRAVVEETIARHGAPYVADYVRLNLWAVRPAQTVQ